MKKYLDQLLGLATTATVKDTVTLFIGNVGSAFWGFLFTLLVARSLSIADFGVFSAIINFVNILVSLSDMGISTGSVNFISEHLGKNDESKANEYIKASFVIRILITIIISIALIFLAPIISPKLFATGDVKLGLWAAIVPLFWFPDMFFPFILQAKRKFFESVIYDNGFYIGRLVFVAIFYILGALTINLAFLAFGAGFIVAVILTFIYLRTDFYKSSPGKTEYKNLLKFSGWIGVNRIISSVSGRLDIQMLAAMTTATLTGIYSISSRLATFIIVLTGSFSSVLASRFASFSSKEKEKNYLIKSTLAVLPMVAGVIVVIIFAKPFIGLLFGSKYLPSVPIFQALAAVQIPFLFTAPSVTAIIYSMKKTSLIGYYSFFQIIAIFLLNYFFIPKYGAYGPTLTFAITNVILAVYTWVIVLRHYWYEKN